MVPKTSLFLLCIIPFYLASAIEKDDRVKRNIGIFNVVRFQNEVCEGSNNQQGTCFTVEECENNGGEGAGSCAEGYGVCCTFSINCGQRSSQNNTVFMSNNPVAGACSAVICKIDESISQLRLDFTTFAIGDPSAGGVVAFSMLNGVLDPAGAGVGHSVAGQCLQDTFAVTSPGSVGSDTICGTNSGEHLYIDASDSCNTLLFILGRNPAMEPMWSITVRQYSRDFINLAPAGCDQYHYDNDGTNALATTGTVSSWNFNNGNGRHLANQDQTICIRQDAGMSRLCFSQAGGTVVNDFLISTGVMGDSALIASGLVGAFSGAGAGTMAACGNYGTDGMGIDFDFVHVPGAFANIANVNVPVNGNHNFCGAALVGANGPALTTAGVPPGLAQVGPAATMMSASGTAVSVMVPAVMAMSGQATICTSDRPFRIRFKSDSGEVFDPAPAASETVQTGFSLGYEQA